MRSSGGAESLIASIAARVRRLTRTVYSTVPPTLVPVPLVDLFD